MEISGPGSPVDEPSFVFKVADEPERTSLTAALEKLEQQGMWIAQLKWENNRLIAEKAALEVLVARLQGYVDGGDI